MTEAHDQDQSSPNEPVEPCVEANEPAAHATADAIPALGQVDPAGHMRGSVSSTLLAAGQ